MTLKAHCVLSGLTFATLLGTVPSSPLPPDMYSRGDAPAFVRPVPSGWPALAVAVTAATPVSAVVLRR